MGQSMGGGLALRYAQRRPGRVSKLVLVNPSGLISIGWVYLVRVVPPFLMRLLGKRAIPRRMIKFILERIAYGDPGRVSDRDIDEYWAPTQIPGYTNAVRSTIAEFNWTPLSPLEAREFEVPTLVVLGTEDRVVRNARRAAERLKGSVVQNVVGGHCVHEEHPEAVYDLISAFVQSS
jgi:pimeloyl-ACP methyl ester carboxylesterase